VVEKHLGYYINYLENENPEFKKYFYYRMAQKRSMDAAAKDYQTPKMTLKTFIFFLIICIACVLRPSFSNARNTTAPIVVYDTLINGKRIIISFRPVSDTPGLDRFTLYVQYGKYKDSVREIYDRWEDTTIFEYCPMYIFNTDGSISHSKVCILDTGTLLLALPRNNLGSQIYTVKISRRSTKITTKENNLFSEGGFFIFKKDRRIGIPQFRYLDNGKMLFYNFGSGNPKPVNKKFFLDFSKYDGFTIARLHHLQADYHKLFK